MKKSLSLLLILLLLFITRSFSQSAHVPGPAEQKMTDSLCRCVAKLDLSKIKTKQEALAAYTNCVVQHIDILKDLADERKVDIGDHDAMEKVGVDIALNLIKQSCKGFSPLAVIMGGKDGDDETSKIAYGNFRRIETKGFNYLIVTDQENKEKTFIWLRQFPDSENFMSGGAKYIGKRLKIKYQELEVYLPQAKGYYKVKEITGIEVL